MKVPLFSTGLTSITLVTFAIHSFAGAWPHNPHHHHGLVHHAHHVHPVPFASSGSGDVYNSAGGFRTGYGSSTGAPSVRASHGLCHGHVHNCTLGSLKPSIAPAKSINATKTLSLASSRGSTSSGKQGLTSTRTASTTTTHITETSTVVITVHNEATVQHARVDRVSSVTQEINVAKRVASPYPNAEPAASENAGAFSVGSSSSANSFGGSYQSFQLGPFPNPSVTSSATPPSSSVSSSVCPSSNNTIYTSSQGQNYQVICDVDYLNNDLNFILASSFGDCVQRCDTYNAELDSGSKCVGALFVPSRLLDQDDCYLKSSVDNPTPAKIGICGAILISGSSSSLTSSSSPSSTTVIASSVVSIVPAPTISHASGTSIMIPSATASYLLGPSSNKPSRQYINWKAPDIIKLASNLLAVGTNDLLSTSYPLSPDTGILELNASTQALLADLTGTPHISRDGGKGGYLNGQHLFIFCDTGAYTAPAASSNGNFLGFVSSSVAVDTGMNGLSKTALNLEDGIGQWSDNAGRMRGFSPMTEGEQSYNLAMQGGGQRYAVWPESSLIPLDATNAVIYAPIIYDNVNMATKAAVFTYTGATLLTITAGGKGGPLATRTVDKIFKQDEVEWGCIGGIRSWGLSGVGGTDGKVYIFGKVEGGLLLGRTGHDSIADRSSYEYWTGNTWSHGMPSTSSSSYFITGNFMDVDMFYSPRHLTFIIVYMTTWADNTFYFRYLEANQAILPPSAPGADPSSDYVEHIVQHPWSKEQVLYKAAPGSSGKYIYSGAVHQGYFGDDDITNGGTKMLLSWTAPTGKNPASEDSEYKTVTAEVEWA